MKIAMIGLGKMGSNMTQRLLNGGHQVVAYDLNEAAIQAVEAVGAEGARTLDDLAAKLPQPRAAWVMVPSGNATKTTIQALADRFSAVTSSSMAATATTKTPSATPPSSRNSVSGSSTWAPAAASGVSPRATP